MLLDHGVGADCQWTGLRNSVVERLRESVQVGAEEQKLEMMTGNWKICGRVTSPCRKEKNTRRKLSLRG